MIPRGFTPYVYESFSALPEEAKPLFKAYENGFVNASALDLEAAQQEAPVENNIVTLNQMFSAMASDHMAALEAWGGQGSFQPLDDNAKALFAAHLEDTQKALDVLPERVSQTAELIRNFRLETPIDNDFVNESMQFLDLHAGQPDQETAADFMAHATYALENRIADRVVERSLERRRMTDISDSRQVTIVVAGDGQSARLEMPLQTDPEKFPVALGPKAVTELLGGPLSDTDYATIARMLVDIPGPAGGVFRNYHDAVGAWADAYDIASEMDVQIAQGARKLAASEVQKLFNFSLFTDIPLNAIFTTVIRRHHKFNDLPSPQPFEN